MKRAWPAGPDFGWRGRGISRTLCRSRALLLRLCVHRGAECLARLRDLVGRVRRGGFRSSEISDPTVTISSLGERGVDALLPVFPLSMALLSL